MNTWRFGDVVHLEHSNALVLILDENHDPKWYAPPIFDAIVLSDHSGYWEQGRIITLGITRDGWELVEQGPDLLLSGP